eukprot:TRINITY_DN2903_c0_g1_i2.p1 TRINITY_DN2903_c0_g1~~TRINITY_DN2903_c0_g1_i2.p1  ORF type:complete len:319 (-),score=27.05 TRINITY_DN2903_c0_g1_i2:181-1137(-)
MCVLMPLLGITNSLVSSSGFAFSAIFCSKYPEFITTYNTGTGLAGILLSLMRIIVIVGFKDKKSSLGYQVLSFFGVATVLVLMAVLCNAKFMTNPVVKQSMKQENWRDQQTTQDSQVQIEYEDFIQIPNELETNLVEQQTGKKNWAFLIKTFVNTQPYMILLLIVYIQTYFLYPGMIIEKIFVPDMSNSWKLVLLTLSFNFFDTLGKFLTYYNQKLKFSKISTSLVVVSRFVFFPIVFMSIFVKYSIFETIWLPFLIMACFAFTNGLLTGITMILGPSNVKQEAQETAGFLMSFALVTGILIGMFSALPFQHFQNVNV